MVTKEYEVLPARRKTKKTRILCIASIKDQCIMSLFCEREATQMMRVVGRAWF